MPKSWGIHDVFGLDPELLGMLNQPVVGLLLLFPIGAVRNVIFKGSINLLGIQFGLFRK